MIPESQTECRLSSAAVLSVRMMQLTSCVDPRRGTWLRCERRQHGTAPVATTHRCCPPGPALSGAAAGACLQRSGPRSAKGYRYQVSGPSRRSCPDSPLAVHDPGGFVHDARQDIDVLVHPAVFAELAMISRVVQVGCLSVGSFIADVEISLARKRRSRAVPCCRPQGPRPTCPFTAVPTGNSRLM